MQLDKKKYKKSEVEEIVCALKTEYENKLLEQKERIVELLKGNSHLSSELSVYKEKEEYLSSAIISAEKTAEKIKKKAELQYALEMDKLRNFNNKWNDYFLLLKEKYPMYAPIDKALDIKQKLLSVLKLSDSKRAVEKLDKLLGDTEKNDYTKVDLAVADGNGFNLDEVLNPGQLELEDLCKELGLMEEE